MIREYEANGWDIDSIQIAEDADKAARYLNRLVSGLWVLDISNGVADTIVAYQEHKDWVGVAEKSFAEVVVIPKIVAYVTEDVVFAGINFTPVGLVATLAVGSVEGATILISNHYANKLLD